MSSWTSIAKRLLPELVQDRIRHLGFFNSLRARSFAKGPKRLDVCAAQLASVLHLAGDVSLDGRVCLEIGSGWVLSHAVAMHLLGARRVVATDIARLAYPNMLRQAIRSSTISLVRDLLSPFGDRTAICRRLDRLTSIRRFTFETLGELGIEYMAPIDLARQPLGTPIEFAFSTSVLEHVPVDDVEQLLQNVACDLVPGGWMLHCIHLEDHLNFKSNPFAFLSLPAAKFTARVQGNRGNRLRKSGWRAILDNIDELDSRFIYEWLRWDKPLPPAIDASVRYTDEEDLRISHLGLLAIRKR